MRPRFQVLVAVLNPTSLEGTFDLLPLIPHSAFSSLAAHARRLSAIPWTGACYRVAGVEWSNANDLFSGEGARRIGGRWNVAGVATAYASLDPKSALAEWLTQFERAGIPITAKLPVALSWGAVRLQRVLDLTSVVLGSLGTTSAAVLTAPWEAENLAGRESLPQAIGRAAVACGHEALLVPSAVVPAARNLVIYPAALLPGSQVTPHGLRTP